MYPARFSSGMTYTAQRQPIYPAHSLERNHLRHQGNHAYHEAGRSQARDAPACNKGIDVRGGPSYGRSDLKDEY